MKRKRKIIIFKISLVIIFIGCLIAALSWFFKLKAFAIENINVSGAVSVDAVDIHSIAQKYIAGDYLFLFPRSNRLIYPKGVIESGIKRAFPVIQDVIISASGNVLSISVTERTSAYLWCLKLQCYFMDSTGFVYAPAPNFSGNAFLVLSGNITGDPIGSYYLDQDRFSSLKGLVSEMALSGIKINSIDMTDPAQSKIVLTKGGSILFKADQDIGALTDSIMLVKDNTKVFDGKASSTLDYLDMRFGNKVFYKKIGDNPVQVDK